jgi:hypothetical protein
MPAGAPTALMMEVELTAPGVWTDITVDVQWETGVQIGSAGRTSEFSATQPRTMSFDLDNQLGTWTPKRQTLADGVTPHPYYPFLLPRKRVRYSYFVGANKYIRFFGYIKAWQPMMENGVFGVTHVDATDRFDSLSRVTLDSPIREETLFDGVTIQFPLTDPAGTLTSPARTGNGALAVVGAGTALLFGDNGPGYGEGTGVKFAPSSSSAGQILQWTMPALTLTAFTIEVWVNTNNALPAWASGAGTESILALCAAADGTMQHGLYLLNGVPSYEDGFANVINAPGGIVNLGWHHIAARRATGTGVVTIFVDGVNSGVTAAGAGFAQTSTVLSVGDWAAPNAFVPARFQGNITDARMQRWLTDAGLTSADWNLDTGIAVVNTYPQAGKDVVSACQDMALTEAGGGAVYMAADGRVRFANRNFRNPAAPGLTLDAFVDLDPSQFAPSLDELTLINQSTGSRGTLSGTQSTQVVTDPVSAAAYGPATDPGFTSYATTDLDVLEVAQWRVANNAYPAYRLRQVAVDLMKAENNLYTALTTIEIGDRIRITNLPLVAGPLTTVDLIVEGWTETPATDSYLVVFDATPADNPAVFLWDDANYGRWQSAGSTLNTTITNAGTTVVVATPSGPTWSTSAGDYPSKITINEEHIQLNGVPGGATSPQTWTGVTRGVDGSVAAAQTSGATVEVYQTSFWGL